ncbi:30S ribosomal protein S16 [Candidatus Curtissbacteria bacterium]|nr:30S ribosomal protein S16 [Candidatus Curtissbacteria bacterium]
MSVKIRLAQTGKKHQISYRIVAQDAKSKRDGKFLEILGFYNPHIPQFVIKKEQLSFWVQKGAKPTEAVAKLLENNQANENQVPEK